MREAAATGSNSVTEMKERMRGAGGGWRAEQQRGGRGDPTGGEGGGRGGTRWRLGWGKPPEPPRMQHCRLQLQNAEPVAALARAATVRA
jgi:hypothetical protein